MASLQILPIALGNGPAAQAMPCSTASGPPSVQHPRLLL